MSPRTPCVLLVLLVACGGGAQPTPTTPEPTPAPEPAPVTADDPLDRFEPVPPEVDRARLAVALPQVPSFELPSVPEGFKSVKELRVAGARLAGTPVKVNAFVTSVYDCVTAVGLPGEKKAAVERRIKKDPALCAAPHFTIGASRDATDPNVVRVVGVPRGQKLAVGDRVIVSGTVDAEGAITFAALERVKGGG